MAASSQAVQDFGKRLIGWNQANRLSLGLPENATVCSSCPSVNKYPDTSGLDTVSLLQCFCFLICAGGGGNVCSLVKKEVLLACTFRWRKRLGGQSTLVCACDENARSGNSFSKVCWRLAGWAENRSKVGLK